MDDAEGTDAAPEPVPEATTGGPLRFVGVGAPVTVAGVALALVTWPIAFNVGAYGEVLYGDVHSVVVASFVLLASTFVVPPPYGRVRAWVVRALLAGPALWLTVAVVAYGSTSEAFENPAFVLWIAVIVASSVPLTLKMLVDLFTPEMTVLRSRRLTAWLIGIIAVVAAAGVYMGAENARFMICEDFAVAGAALPESCAPG